MSPASTLRRALALMSVSLLLEQIGLAVAVFLLSIAWLRVPDASVLDVVLTVLLGIVTIAVAGAGESWIILHLSERERNTKRLLRGALILLVGVALWFGWNALLEFMRGHNDSLRAGYINSRFPRAWRHVFSYPHILLWLEWSWAALQWIGSGIIGTFIFSAIASVKPMRAAMRALRSITYWCALIFGSAVAAILTGALIAWTPGHGLRIEMLSLTLRLFAAVLMDASIVCLLLSTLAVFAKQTNALYATPAGTPVDSQPRTVDEP